MDELACTHCIIMVTFDDHAISINNHWMQSDLLPAAHTHIIYKRISALEIQLLLYCLSAPVPARHSCLVSCLHCSTIACSCQTQALQLFLQQQAILLLLWHTNLLSIPTPYVRVHPLVPAAAVK